MNPKHKPPQPNRICKFRFLPPQPLPPPKRHLKTQPHRQTILDRRQCRQIRPRVINTGPRTRPANRRTIPCSRQYCNWPRVQPVISAACLLVKMGVEGLEPSTLRLRVTCSNQLSYTPASKLE